MLGTAALAVVLLIIVPRHEWTGPACEPVAGRNAEKLQGRIRAGRSFQGSTASGWILRLDPIESGWYLTISVRGREHEDLSRLTPPWHSVPNDRQLEGWHLRNGDKSRNDGTINAPGEHREFIFSPAVGRTIEYTGSAGTIENVERVRAFGRGWLHLDKYRLTAPRHGKRAAFEWLEFSACLTWPADQQVGR